MPPYIQMLRTARALANFYFAGRLLRQNDEMVVSDRLGSVVFRKNLTNSAIQRFSYYPYGQEKEQVTTQDREKFATYWRDSLTGWDYADQRYYNNQAARFATPDPYKAGGGAEGPQSWNRYSYVEGDPVNWRDPRGLYVCDVGVGEPDYAVCEDLVIDVSSPVLQPQRCPGDETVPAGQACPVADKIKKPQIDAETNKKIRPLVGQAGNKMSRTRCNEVFTKLGIKIDDVARMGQSFNFFDTTGSFGDLTQDDVSGNGSRDKLKDSFEVGATAMVLRERNGSISQNVILRAGFFSDPLKDLSAFHEVLHYGFQLGDRSLMIFLADNGGFRHKGDYEDSHQITEWFANGCPDMSGRR